jgi:hypothetical protein
MQKIITRAAVLAILATGAQASTPSATALKVLDIAKAPATAPLIQEARRGRGADDGPGHIRRGRGKDDPVGHT